jgi:N-acetylglutamate synthase-like GNAT family acetyltransferase
MKNFEIREITEADKTWIDRFIVQEWGSSILVSRGKVYRAADLAGFLAVRNNKKVGLVTYHIENKECEIVTLNSIVENIGVGSGLINVVKKIAEEAGCKRLWLLTTNDNTPALRFYQKKGFRLFAVYPNAIEKSRELKQQIPHIGLDGIPIRDEIELEMILDE